MLFLLLACFFDADKLSMEEEDEERDVSASGFAGSLGFDPMSTYFGGAYLIFFDRNIACEELYWVSKIYRNGESPYYEKDFTALQITFNDSDVMTGEFAFGGEAPVRGTYIENFSPEFNIMIATEGVIASTAVGENQAFGSFDLILGEDSIEGEYATDYCATLDW